MKPSEVEERKRLGRIPKVSRFLPFNRFSPDYLTRGQILTMHRNRVVVNIERDHRDWLDANCQDIFTFAPISEFGKKCELMFLSQDDKTLFILAF